MKDLFVFAADADAKEFITAILLQPEALGIRPISFDVDRHPMRDGGMVNTGAELTRSYKTTYSKVLLIWDHEGSGKERFNASAVEAEVHQSLERITWSSRCAAIAIEPELERWIWTVEPAIESYYGITREALDEFRNRFLSQNRMSLDEAKARAPKELFHHVVVDCIRRGLSPKDFQELGRRAGVERLCADPSFSRIVAVLQTWFPEKI